jgi:hypothetical protein
LLSPPAPKQTPPPKMKLWQKLKKTHKDKKLMLNELNAVCNIRCLDLEAKGLFEPVKPINVIAAIRD